SKAVSPGALSGMAGGGACRSAMARSAGSSAPVEAPGETAFEMNIEAETDAEAANIAAVEASMRALMRTPTLVAGAVMPDACPAGPVGTIPVGGVAAAQNAIHPGFHSADICCSVAVSVLGDVDPKAALDAAQKLTHFGGGGRGRSGRLPAPKVLERFAGNRFLTGLEDAGHDHFGTQGDGNHFLYVGRLKSTGAVAMATHHGSRKPGAMLYKRGMVEAQRRTKEISPETPAGNAWLVADSEEGQAYWQALQIIREWTKANHAVIHARVAEALGVKAEEFFWNEHNFVFQKSDGRFYHGKGATPAWADYAADTNGLTLIPLNMAEPILITRGLDAARGLGFSPHGAGRNMSRSAHVRALGDYKPADQVRVETKGIDVRFYSGRPDVSELPSAYKDAASVRRQIDQFGLAEVVDEIEPYGAIMAGDWMADAPWRKQRQEKREAKARGHREERRTAKRATERLARDGGDADDDE
ncbi:MAG: RtcB family protein, partial [Pseudomonadota bacterium]